MSVPVGQPRIEHPLLLMPGCRSEQSHSLNRYSILEEA